MGQGVSAKSPERIVREQERNTRTDTHIIVAQPVSLQSVEDILARAIPSHPVMCGIYFLIRDSKVVYVGQSLHVEARLATHALQKQFDSWAWIPCDIEDLISVERAYLDIFLPEDNKDAVTKRLRLPPRVWTEAELAEQREIERLAKIEAEEEAEYQKTMEIRRAIARSLG
jgi:hypothetical protein